MQLLAGRPNKLIAEHLSMAEGTVKAHLNSVYRVLKVKNRSQAILLARDLRII
jgi:DNA-binding CsgD family transcriptional regulator